MNKNYYKFNLLDNKIIDAHLGIVSHVPFYQENESIFINQVEWKILKIFASHFRKVTLIRPESKTSQVTSNWEAIPDNVNAISLRDTNPDWRYFAMQIGLPPKNLRKHLSDIDVVYGRLPGFEAYHAIKLAKKLNKTTLVSLHGDWPEVYQAEWDRGIKRLLAPIWINYSRYIFNWVCKNSDHIFTVGETLKDKYASEIGEVCVFANYVLEKNDIYMEPVSTKPPIKVLFVGSLSPRKGLNYLIQAIHHLIQIGYDINLTLVGSGTHEEEYKNTIKQLFLCNRVDFAGYINMGKDLWDLYKSHDVFILPSVAGEGNPKVIFEAMAMNCAVIATDIGNTSNIIKDNFNGYLIKPESSKLIAEKLKLIIDNPDIAASFTKNARIFVEQNTYSTQKEKVGVALISMLT